MDKLGIVLLTYASSLDSPRHAYAMRTLQNLIQYVEYSGPVRWHIADDGSPNEHLNTLAKFGVSKTGGEWSVSNSMRGGYGASYNLATQMLHSDCDFMLMVEDDWELTRELDLDPLVESLKDGLNCIRLGYIGWTQELRGKIAAYANQTFLEFDPESEERHVFSGHPRLETVSFQRSVGPWPEGVDAGTTEFIVAGRSESRYKVAWPMDLGVRAGQVYGTLFAHIGATQARTDQVAV